MPDSHEFIAESDDQALLRDALSKLLRARYSFDQRAKVISSADGFSRAMWSALADMGILGASLPEDAGGGASFSALQTIGEAFGRALVVEPYLPTVVLAGRYIAHAGSQAQKQAFLPDIIEGRALWALAFSEAASRYNLNNVRLSATRDGEAYILNGSKAVVYGAPHAERLVVIARTSGGPLDERGLTAFVVDAGAQGLTCRGYPTIDGLRAGELDFDNVRVGADSILGEPDLAAPVLAQVIDEATAFLGAEAVGAIIELNEKTIEHCKTRILFGQPLSKSQVVQHRLVEMQVAQEHAQAMVRRTFLELEQSPARRAASVSAMKVQVAREADFVAKWALQLHGAMGLTDELDISHYFKRLTMINGLFGDADFHLRRFIAHSPRVAMSGPEALEEAAELMDLSPDELAFRDEVRRFYAENLTDELRQAANLTLWHMSSFEHGKRWQEILYEHGYGAPEWPVEYGGRDWTPTQRQIWAIETARARPPLIMLMGRIYCAPCIMRFGTEEQKAEFLPPIISGKDWWAQGYSEPGAGSDLAALQLAAEDGGDHYILNGSKIWTTFAHHANRIFCLVRTSVSEKKQAGITFLLIDMDTPGIEVRPIHNLVGDHDFNQVFFTDVRVPKSRRLGEENAGWAIARHLLLYEHGANLQSVNMENIRRLGWLREIASLELDGSDRPLLADPDFSRHVAEVAIGVQAMEFASRQEFARSRSGEPPSPKNELLTLRSRELGQRLTELAMQAIGNYGAVHQPQARRPGSNVDPIGPEHALLPMPFYLTQRGATIAGGAPEVHRNNLARHLLHL